ncbi:MAG: hypothetical protein HKN56_07020 [Gammaproteobacteria bacterium]|nr:hypothetical protein [Gammaproteobacteria bacterium]
MLKELLQRLSLLMIPLVLSACAVQPTDKEIAALQMDAMGQCFTDCELVHSGQIRACIRRPATEGRGTFVSGCITDSYATLGACYSSCDEEE